MFNTNLLTFPYDDFSHGFTGHVLCSHSYKSILNLDLTVTLVIAQSTFVRENSKINRRGILRLFFLTSTQKIKVATTLLEVVDDPILRANEL